MDECMTPHNGELPPPCEARLSKIRENWREVVEDLAFQFAYRSNNKKRRWLHTGGLSALESAFEALGWNDPHYTKEGGCDHPGCAAWATCGTPTDDGYKSVCGDHMKLYWPRTETARNQPNATDCNVNENGAKGG